MTVIVSFSLPEHICAALAAEAGRMRRSRSFIVAEAVTQYLAGRQKDAFDAARDQTLREGLALPPAERVRLAEELWQEFERGHPLARPWTASFETIDEYDHWRRTARQRPA
ncbi:MAG TPA: hypothetical protein VFO95_01195 [Gemmatimonadales bacterium]|nr:hypothetical protein [Gemmatimonadales bacterium]